MYKSLTSFIDLLSQNCVVDVEEKPEPIKRIIFSYFPRVLKLYSKLEHK